MTVRNLNMLFRPNSVALIGASERERSLGMLIARNLQRAGFRGRLQAVNPKYRQVAGLPCYPRVKALPECPDLAVIVTPARTVLRLVEELAEQGTRAAVVISAGFAEMGNEGAALQRQMLEAAKPYNFRILGPNCLGLMVPDIGLNASFAHIDPRPGRIALLAQSGALLTAILDWADEKDIGFSHLVSLGSMADVDFGDTLNYLSGDPHTDAILLYLESATHARKFMSAARAAARVKPTFVLKAGRHEAGARAAASHSGALAGLDAVYGAAINRAGMLRVHTMPELFDMVETLACAGPMTGDRLAILTNGGGLGVLAADALTDEGGRLAELLPETVERLDRVLPAAWSHGNPVDIIGDAPPERYRQALQALLEDTTADAVLVLNCPVAVASSTAAARAVIEGVAGGRHRPVFSCWVGGHAVQGGRALFAKARIPAYESPTEAVHAFMQMVRYRRNQDLLMETPPVLPEHFEPDRGAAATVIDQVLAQGREWLTEWEAKAVLAAYEIPTVSTQVARSAGDAARLAAEIGAPVALKVLSPDITHKSDVGGVVLDLDTAERVSAAARDMEARVRAAHPDSQLDGFTVQSMIRWPGAVELIVGVVSDRLFGPVVLFGHGGTAVELIDDTAMALPPLNMTLARDLMARTRVYRLLKGYRDHPPANLTAIAATLIKVSALVSELEHIAELDINPLLAAPQGVIALDARIRLSQAICSGGERLAIRPYPKELEEILHLHDGTQFLIRPIRAEDEPALVRAFGRLDPEEIRLRFFHSMKTLEHPSAARLTQIDYDREMALVLTDPRSTEQADIVGVARLSADPDRQRAEFALIVGRHFTGRGLGALLLNRLIRYARSQGIGELFGDVLRENEAMLALCRHFGFTSTAGEDPSVHRVRLVLT